MAVPHRGGNRGSEEAAISEAWPARLGPGSASRAALPVAGTELRDLTRGVASHQGR